MLVKKNIFFLIFCCLWISLQWTYSGMFPRPADDWKEVILYTTSGLFFFYYYKNTTTSLKPEYFWILGAYLLVALISLKSGIAWFDGLVEVSRLILWMAIAFIFSQMNNEELDRLMIISTLSASFIALGTLLEAYGINTWKRIPVNLTTMTPIGHVSYYGLFMTGHIPISYYLLSKSKRKIYKATWIVAILLLLSALFYSGTRASLVGLFLSYLLAVTILLKHKLIPSKKILWQSISGIITIIIILIFLKPHYRDQKISTRLTELTNLTQQDTSNLPKLDASSNVRLNGYLITLKFIREKPLLGWGIDSFRFVYPEYAEGYQYAMMVWYMHPHNEILDQLANVGLLGSFFFWFLWLIFFLSGFKKIKAHDDNWAKVLLAMTGLTIILASWQFDTNYQMPLSRAFTALFTGILLKYEFQATNKPKKIGVYLLVGLCLLMTSCYYLSQYHIKKSEISESQRNIQGAITEANTAFLFSPLTFDSLFRYSNTHFHYGDHQKASRAIKSMTDLYPYTVMALMTAADFEFANGNYIKAKEYAKHALRNDHSLERAKRLLADPRIQAVEVPF